MGPYPNLAESNEHPLVLGESSLDDRSAQVFPYNIFTYCSICRVDCKFERNKIKKNPLVCGEHLRLD
jgi:hypothetical protein